MHLRSLPSFGDALGQQDSELLLSFLTVPYIRLPLVVKFFATEDRVHALRAPELRGRQGAALASSFSMPTVGIDTRVLR